MSQWAHGHPAVAVPAACILGEGCLWDTETQRLYWVDIQRHQVYRFDPESRTNETFQLGDVVSTVVLTNRSGWLISQAGGLAFLDPDTGMTRGFRDVEPRNCGRRLNDGKCDPRGRLWVGSMVEKGPPNSAGLFRVDADGTCTQQLSGIECSNGLVWSSDERYMYHVDSPTRQVCRFDYEPNTGRIANRQVVFEAGDDGAVPDGMTIDAQDQLWIALWGGGRVLRVDPTNGQVRDSVEVPARNVTSCALGGPNLNVLYISTARIGTSDEELQGFPLAGSLFEIEVEVPGVPSQRFAGPLDGR